MVTREQFEVALGVFRAEPGVTVEVTVWPGDTVTGRRPYRLCSARQARVRCEDLPGVAARLVFLASRWECLVSVCPHGGDGVVEVALMLPLSDAEYAETSACFAHRRKRAEAEKPRSLAPSWTPFLLAEDWTNEGKTVEKVPEGHQVYVKLDLPGQGQEVNRP